VTPRSSTCVFFMPAVHDQGFQQSNDAAQPVATHTFSSKSPSQQWTISSQEPQTASLVTVIAVRRRTRRDKKRTHVKDVESDDLVQQERCGSKAGHTREGQYVAVKGLSLLEILTPLPLAPVLKMPSRLQLLLQHIYHVPLSSLERLGVAKLRHLTLHVEQGRVHSPGVSQKTARSSGWSHL